MLQSESFRLSLVTSVHETINAPVSEVWDAITTPELIKKYFFGTNTITDWKPGHPIMWKGEWKGKSYLDKGTILDFEPEHLLRFTYLSSMAGKEDTPENYAVVTYELSGDDRQTSVTIIQENIDTEKTREKMKDSWAKVLDSLKALVESR